MEYWLLTLTIARTEVQIGERLPQGHTLYAESWDLNLNSSGHLGQAPYPPALAAAEVGRRLAKAPGQCQEDGGAR